MPDGESVCGAGQVEEGAFMVGAIRQEELYKHREASQRVGRRRGVGHGVVPGALCHRRGGSCNRRDPRLLIGS